jgi:small GTP-binding protein
MATNEHTFKLVIVGDAAVGKTSLITQFATRKFRKEYIQTIGCQLNVAELNVGDVLIRLVIWDLAGQPRFQSVRTLYFVGSDAAVVVYDVSRRSTFENVDGWLQALRKAVPDKIPMVLVANKVDLASQREVAAKDGEQSCLSHDFDAYLETSARTGENVGELFDTITRLLIQDRLTELRERLTPFLYTSFAS